MIFSSISYILILLLK